MSLKPWIVFTASFVLLSFVKAQNKKTDSLAVASTLKAIITACKEVSATDLAIKGLGRFYKAAPYIVYRGPDKKRTWKDFMVYTNATEKTVTDGICKRIIRSVNLDEHYKVIKYFTEKESEGIWHVLVVSYKINEVENHASFAFLKIGKRFGLGDVDQNYK